MRQIDLHLEQVCTGRESELGVIRLSDICLWKCEAVGTYPVCPTLHVEDVTQDIQVHSKQRASKRCPAGNDSSSEHSTVTS